MKNVVKKERVLCFTYYNHMKIDKLIIMIKQNNIDFIQYGFDFVILKSGKTWKSIMALINDVKAAKYTFKTINYKQEKWEHGTVREVCGCK